MRRPIESGWLCIFKIRKKNMRVRAGYSRVRNKTLINRIHNNFKREMTQKKQGLTYNSMIVEKIIDNIFVII